MAPTEIKVDEKQAGRALRAMLEREIEEGNIRIELCGHLEHAPNVKGFTLDKTRYRLRLVDETEASVKVLIEPI